MSLIARCDIAHNLYPIYMQIGLLRLIVMIMIARLLLFNVVKDDIEVFMVNGSNLLPLFLKCPIFD